MRNFRTNGVWDTVGSLGWFVRKKEFNIRLNGNIPYCYQAMAIDERRRQFPVSLWDENRKNGNQTVEQVWFPGVHSDVGGRNNAPAKETGIPDITLKWMLENAESKGLRLKGHWKDILKSDPVAVNESWKGPWRLWGPKTRLIENGEKIHVSALRLMEDPNSGYRPRNLPQRYEEVGP